MAAFTSEERRRLYELAGELVDEYPQVARALVGTTDFHRLQRRVTRRTGRSRFFRCSAVLCYLPLLITLASLPLLISGLLLDLPAVIAFGAVAMVNGPALIFASGRGWPRD